MSTSTPFRRRLRSIGSGYGSDRSLDVRMSTHPRVGRRTGPSATPDDWAAAIAGDPLALPEQSPEWIAAMDGRRVPRRQPCVRPSRDASRRSSSRSSGPGPAMLWSPPPAWGVGGTVGGSTSTMRSCRSIVADLRALGQLRVAVRIDARHEALWQAAARRDDVTLPGAATSSSCARRPTNISRRCRNRLVGRFGWAARSGAEVVESIGRVACSTSTTGCFSARSSDGPAKQHEPVRLARFRAARRDPIVEAPRDERCAR